MKNLILLLALCAITAKAGTCSSISRSNYSTNQVLTSSSLNTQLNTVYSAVNSFDGGCITAGTLEADALNSSDFAALYNTAQSGCLVSYTDANTVSISKCTASVNGYLINKSTATSLAFGCSSCSSDTSSTVYYVYIATGSSGSTLTGLILTTAPNADGYDNSGNKVLARFYNNSSSNIDQYSIDQWHVNRFIPTNSTDVSYTPAATWSTNSTWTGKYRREGAFMVVQFKVALAGAPTSATLAVDIPTGYVIDSARILETTEVRVLGTCAIVDASTPTYAGATNYSDTNTLAVRAPDASTGYVFLAAVTQALPVTFANGDSINCESKVPIVGWND